MSQVSHLAVHLRRVDMFYAKYTGKKLTLRHKYNNYLHQTSAIMFTIHFTAKQASFHLPSTITDKIDSYVNVIYSSADLHC